MGTDSTKADHVRLGVRLIQIDMRPSARTGGNNNNNALFSNEDEDEDGGLGIDPDPQLTASIQDLQCIVKCEEVRKMSRPASSIHNDNQEGQDQSDDRGASSSTM